MILPDRALRRLAVLRLRGGFRKQLRWIRRPAGAAFAIVGLLVMLGWFVLLTIGFVRGDREPVQPELLIPGAQVGCTLLALMTLAGALNHRGLYLPREEIERLLAAPISRSDLVRYRLLIGCTRAFLGSLILGMVVLGRVPRPLFGFLGAVITTLSLPILGQLASLLAGELERRLQKRLPRRPIRFASLLIGIFVWLLFMGFLISFFTESDGLSRKLEELGLEGGLGAVIAHPWVRAATSALRPWARMITASDLGEFLRWGGLSIAIGAALFELTARLPTDFRELSMQTSADVARRLRRQRGGLGASSSRIEGKAAGWRVPWLFGRGPFGALAWRKTASIVRKARGTFAASAFVLAILTLASVSIGGPGAQNTVGSAAFLAVLGTIYLCSGLRFDFRDDLEQMDVIKSWPLGPARVFLATLLPEVLLVSLLIAAAIAARSLIMGSWHPALLAILALQPFLALTWVILDNAVYLYAPVRYQPGQEGALHHSGRTLVMMLLRLVVLAAVGATVMAGFSTFWLLELMPGVSREVALGVGIGLGSMVLVLDDVLLIRAGGSLLRRFDVARDRG